MKAWLGHYGGTKKQWFIVFARTKDDAVRFVDCETAEPDYDSVRPLRFEGMFGFSVKPVPEGHGEEGDTMYTMLHEDGDWLTFHGDDERIRKEMSEPDKPSPAMETSPVAALMRVSDPRVFATYLDPCPRCRKKHVGACSPVVP